MAASILHCRTASDKQGKQQVTLAEHRASNVFGHFMPCIMKLRDAPPPRFEQEPPELDAHSNSYPSVLISVWGTLAGFWANRFMSTRLLLGFWDAVCHACRAWSQKSTLHTPANSTARRSGVHGISTLSALMLDALVARQEILRRHTKTPHGQHQDLQYLGLVTVLQDAPGHFLPQLLLELCTHAVSDNEGHVGSFALWYYFQNLDEDEASFAFRSSGIPKPPSPRPPPIIGISEAAMRVTHADASKT